MFMKLYKDETEKHYGHLTYYIIYNELKNLHTLMKIYKLANNSVNKIILCQP